MTNEGSDLGLLARTAGTAKNALGVETIQAVADRGYYKGEDIQACQDAGIEAYVARPQRGSAAHDGLFRKDEFAYDAAADSYHARASSACIRCIGRRRTVWIEGITATARLAGIAPSGCGARATRIGR